jgi:hypothetical protein
MPLYRPVIIHDVKPGISNTLLILISKTGQEQCGMPLYLPRQPIGFLLKDATMQPGDCWKGIAINRWSSVDAQLWALLSDILTVIGCSTIVQKMHTASIGNQFIVSMYYHLNPGSPRYLSFWTTTWHIIYIISDAAPMYFNTISRQITT